ncbi:hypothetical protein [Oceanithermus desulfurans]|uniref:Uncharacterized protein n=2 Tax=Oceanithermus desulfurans TaxID=227924 RepID=A0A511RLN9_9DEIN|nr:hypothetical protein [Oceanithermus desulfurans]MBB6030847.1 hypothetical protein [Oceanithermus desulfurans]GEM90578.1 hypothetical protein ODE01S_20120 [Oceanithermus desulfurans NBRC 100063]
MKKWMLGALLLGFLSACNINIILPGTPIVVDGPAVESNVLGEGESARFELLVGADPVRIDATDVTNAAAGSLRLRVFDANDAVYAQTVSRQYFTAPQPEVLGSGAVGLGITPNGVYSVNLPANFGKAYVEVTNLAGDPTMVRVSAVTRQGDIAKDNAYSFDATATGALLYLGQLDTWTYTGTGPATLELAGGTTVHARAKVVRGIDTQTVLEPGEEFTDLQNGDFVYVQAQGSGALAGFCNTLPGCADGITSGEYTLQVIIP